MVKGQLKNGFIKDSVKPLVGTLYNAQVLPNSLKEATLEVANLVAGDPVAVLVTQANQATGQNEKYNPNNQVIKAKGTTITGGTGAGAESDVSGFLLVNSNDVVETGGVGIPQQGQRVLYAPLGQGAIVWLEVHADNKTDFESNQNANVGLTIDSAKSGVKVATTADETLSGAKLIHGLTDANKIVVTAGVAELKTCYAVAVQLL